MIIALIGNDGSGKTTLAAKLAAQLESEGRQVKLLQEFSYPLLGLVRRLFGNKPGAGVANVPARGPGEQPPLSTRLLPYIMWADTTLQTLRFRTFARDTVVIKDRCAYDYLATWRELGVTNGAVEFLYRINPKPDVAFYIDVEPSSAYDRRAREPGKDSGKGLDFYHLRKRLYDELYENGRIAHVDNNSTPAAALHHIRGLLKIRERLTRHHSIALSGLDGAGKSTTATQLAELLRRLNVRYVVVHFYYNYLILKLAGLVRQKPAADKNEQHTRSLQTEAHAARHGKSRLWVAFVLADAALQYAFYRVFARGRLIVFDRFFHDYLVSFDFLKAPYNKALLLKLFPRPDKYFLQIADHAVLYARKPEHSPEFFASCYQKYQELAKETGMEVLDSTHQNPNQITETLLGRL